MDLVVISVVFLDGCSIDVSKLLIFLKNVDQELRFDQSLHTKIVDRVL